MPERGDVLVVPGDSCLDCGGCSPECVHLLFAGGGHLCALGTVLLQKATLRHVLGATSLACSGTPCAYFFSDSFEGVPRPSFLLVIGGGSGGLVVDLLAVILPWAPASGLPALPSSLYRAPPKSWDREERGASRCLPQSSSLSVGEAALKKGVDVRKSTAAVAARRRTQEAVDRLRRFPDQTRWRTRGWLIMMRARHQNVLRKKSFGWSAKLGKLKYPNPVNIAKNPTSDEIVMGDQITSDMELEAGMARKAKFVLAVMTVVDVAEEGLFRHIITYL